MALSCVATDVRKKRRLRLRHPASDRGCDHSVDHALCSACSGSGYSRGPRPARSCHVLPSANPPDLVQDFPACADLPRIDVDVGSLPGQPAHRRLVDQDARVWQAVPLALAARRQQHRSHGCRLPHADGHKSGSTNRIVSRIARPERSPTGELIYSEYPAADPPAPGTASAQSPGRPPCRRSAFPGR